jgi:predicted nucleotidyltransferase
MAIRSNTMAKEFLLMIQELQPELKKRFSVRSIGIFGSNATGLSNEQSDVDILVELDEPTFDHYMELKFRLEEVLGREVDLVLKDTLKPRIKPIIEKEILYGQKVVLKPQIRFMGKASSELKAERTR